MLNSELIGEPLSVIKNVTGISEQIQYSDVAFSDANKVKVEELLKKFSSVVTNSDYSSDKFLECVDLGISQNTLNRMADTIKAITPSKKSMYIVSWNTKTNVYCSVTVREVFECANGNFDTEAVIDMGNRNGEWNVVNYTRTVNIKTNNSVVDYSNAFCVDERTADGEITRIDEFNEKTDVKVNPEESKVEIPSVETPKPETPTVEESVVETPIAETPTTTEEPTTSSGSDDFS